MQLPLYLFASLHFREIVRSFQVFGFRYFWGDARINTLLNFDCKWSAEPKTVARRNWYNNMTYHYSLWFLFPKHILDIIMFRILSYTIHAFFIYNWTEKLESLCKTREKLKMRAKIKYIFKLFCLVVGIW